MWHFPGLFTKTFSTQDGWKHARKASELRNFVSLVQITQYLLEILVKNP